MKIKQFNRGITVIYCMVALLAGIVPAKAQSSGRTDTIVLTDQWSPTSIVGSGPFSAFTAPVINSAGQVAFKGSFTSGGTVNGIYLGTTSGVSNVAVEGASAPGGGTYDTFSTPGLNNAGDVVFSSATTGGPGSGLYGGNSSSVGAIAVQGEVNPGGGTFSGFTFPTSSNPWLINDSGQVAFISGSSLDLGSTSTLTSLVASGASAPAGGTFTVIETPGLNDAGQAAFVANVSGGTYYGMFIATSSGIGSVAITGANAPGGGVFSGFSAPVYPPAINSAGQVAFYATTTGTNSPGQGLYLGSTSTVSSIALVGGSAPGGGVFSGFNYPSINNSGSVAFLASTTGASGSGIYVTTASGLKSVALQGASAPGGGTFPSFSTNPFAVNQIPFNNAGDVAFTAFNGSDTNLYLGDGTDLIEAAGYGTSAGGSTITSISLAIASGSQGGGETPLNDLGQIAYEATLANGKSGIFIYTPTLHWRAPESGTWGTSANWTLGLNPASVHDVAIDPTTSLTVTGPTVNTTVNSLQVGGGAGMAILDLQTGVMVSATNGVTVLASGTISGNGTIVGNVTNSGLLSPGDSLGSIQVSGNLLETSAGTLKLEIGGLTAGSGYDTLAITGSMTLGGTLNVALSGGFTPVNGETFDLFQWGSESGSFSQVNLPSLAGGLSWDANLLATNGSITVVPEPGPVALIGGAGVLMLVRRRRLWKVKRHAVSS